MAIVVLDRFSGGDPESWIFRAEQYFQFLGFPEENWLSLASIYLEGDALNWFSWLFRNKQFFDWKHFTEKLKLHFRTQSFLDHQKPTAVELGRFHGENPEVWIFQAERYFEFYGIGEAYKVSLASVYLDGEALRWYQWLFRNNQLDGWEHFTKKVRLRFNKQPGSPSPHYWNTLSDCQNPTIEHKVFEKMSSTDSYKLSRLVTTDEPDAPLEMEVDTTKGSESTDGLVFTKSSQVIDVPASVADEKNSEIREDKVFDNSPKRDISSELSQMVTTYSLIEARDSNLEDTTDGSSSTVDVSEDPALAVADTVPKVDWLEDMSIVSFLAALESEVKSPGTAPINSNENGTVGTTNKRGHDIKPLGLPERFSNTSSAIETLEESEVESDSIFFACVKEYNLSIVPSSTWMELCFNFEKIGVDSNLFNPLPEHHRVYMNFVLPANVTTPQMLLHFPFDPGSHLLTSYSSSVLDIVAPVEVTHLVAKSCDHFAVTIFEEANPGYSSLSFAKGEELIDETNKPVVKKENFDHFFKRWNPIAAEVAAPFFTKATFSLRRKVGKFEKRLFQFPFNPRVHLFIVNPGGLAMFLGVWDPGISSQTLPLKVWDPGRYWWDTTALLTAFSQHLVAIVQLAMGSLTWMMHQRGLAQGGAEKLCSTSLPNKFILQLESFISGHGASVVPLALSFSSLHPGVLMHGLGASYDWNRVIPELQKQIGGELLVIDNSSMLKYIEANFTIILNFMSMKSLALGEQFTYAVGAKQRAVHADQRARYFMGESKQDTRSSVISAQGEARSSTNRMYLCFNGLLLNHQYLKRMQVINETCQNDVWICYQYAVPFAGLDGPLFRVDGCDGWLSKEMAVRCLQKPMENSSKAWSVAYDGSFPLLKICVNSDSNGDLVCLACEVLHNLVGFEGVKIVIVERVIPVYSKHSKHSVEAYGTYIFRQMHSSSMILYLNLEDKVLIERGSIVMNGADGLHQVEVFGPKIGLYLSQWIKQPNKRVDLVWDPG